MSSSAWPRHPASLSCSQDCQPKACLLSPGSWFCKGHFNTRSATIPYHYFSHGDSLPMGTAGPLLLQHTSMCPLVQVSSHKAHTAKSQQWISYTTLASHCSHHKTIPPTGSGGVALHHPTSRVVFSLLDTSLLTNHPIKLLGCHTETLQAAEESSVINHP